MMTLLKYLPFCLFSLGLTSTAVRADILLDLPFDDPKGMIRKSEGIVRADKDFLSSKATLSSGSGGRVLPGFNEGPEGAATDEKGKPTSEARMFAVKDFSPDGERCLRLTLVKDPLVTRSVGIRVLPDSPAQSLSALFSFENGKGKLEGAADFFFRASSEEGSYPKVGLFANCGPLLINVFSDPERGRFTMRAYTDSDSQAIDTNGDGTSDKDSVSATSGKDFVLKSGALYHAALVFRSSPEGQVKMDFCIQEGMGPLNTRETVIASIKPFAVLNGTSRLKPEDEDVISLYLGRTKAGQSLDVAAFRIHKPSPDLLPGFKDQ